MVTGLHFKIYKWERRSDKKGVVMGGGTDHKVDPPRPKLLSIIPPKLGVFVHEVNWRAYL